MEKPETLSRAFIEALKFSREPAYRVAKRAGVHPTTLSRLIHGAQDVQPDDPRIIAVGKVLGLEPSRCFEETAA